MTITQAYKAGRKAFRENVNFDANPFDPYTFGFKAWKQGWMEAAEYHWRSDLAPVWA